ncbi:MAG: HD domain-containing protein [Candidatus Korarchaeota archaeon]|nr:HD domain-containing protein [Thermoproteota archaeon]
MAEDLKILELQDHGLPSRLIHKYIRDPVHAYIPFTRLEEFIVDSDIFQRLRRIHQLQVAYTVYPGATHTRFLHSIGVMHLAGRFILALLRSTYSLQNQEVLGAPEEVMFRVPSFEDLGIDGTSALLSILIATRIGGLLHDIGHMPFSHAFDEAIIANSKKVKSVGIYSHEDIGYYVYKNYLREDIRSFAKKENYEKYMDIDILLETVDAIMLPREKLAAPKKRIHVALRSVVREFLYPADIVDFCLRDSYFTGAMEYGKIDADRLFLFSLILERIVPGSSRIVLGLQKKAIGALRAFLYSRVWLFNNVYFHKFSRLMDYAVKDLIRGMYEYGIIDFEEIITSLVRGEEEARRHLAKLDDNYLLFKALESGEPKLVELANRVLYRRPDLREVFSLEITLDPTEVESVACVEDFDSIVNKFREEMANSLGITSEDLIIDSPPIKFFPLNPYLPHNVFPIVEVDKQRIVGIREANAWAISGARISDLAVFRVLIRKSAMERANLSVETLRRKILQMLTDVEDKIKYAFIKKYSSLSPAVTM